MALAIAFAPGAAADETLPAERASSTSDDTTSKSASLETSGYHDSDHVDVLTPSVSGKIQNVTTGASLQGRYLVDVVSAASADIVSTASRRWTEIRHAGSLEGQYKPHEFGVSAGGSLSSEPDYLSYGLGVMVVHDFDEKNLTLQLGYGFGHDTIGRTGTSFSVFSRELSRGTFSFGATRVINLSTIGSLALDVVIENGDQSKPYRYVPMFARDVAPNVPKGASIEYVTSHRLFERPLEQLPLSRRRFALTGHIAHRFDRSTLRLEERLYDDTWALAASTTDVRWIFDVSSRFSLGPHARFHAQSPVVFWQRAYSGGPTTGWDLPLYRTGDRELGPLWTATGGGGVKWYIGGARSPRDWGIGLQIDAIYTSFLDDLYVTERTGFLGAWTLEGTL